MKKNFKRWLALVLAVVLVSGTCLTHTDSFLWATDGETTEATNENVQTVAEGTGETAEQQTVEQQPVEEQQEVVIPKKEEEPAPAEQEKKEEPKVEKSANSEEQKAEEPAKEEQPENKTEANQTVQEAQPAGETTEGQEVEVVPSDKKENLYNVVFHKPAVDGGTLYVWEEGKEKQEASYINGKFTKEVKEGTTLYFEIKAAENYSVEKVTDKSGQVMTPEKTTENTSTYKMVVKEKNDITILYKEVKVEEPKTEEQPKEEPQVEEPQKNETTETPTEENQVKEYTLYIDHILETNIGNFREVQEIKLAEADLANGDYSVLAHAYSREGMEVSSKEQKITVESFNESHEASATITYKVSEGWKAVKKVKSGVSFFSVYVGTFDDVEIVPADQMPVRISFIYEDGTLAHTAETVMVTEKDGKYDFHYTVDFLPKGFTIEAKSDDTYEVNGNELTATFDEKKTESSVQLTFVAATVAYTVVDKYPGLNGVDSEEVERKDTTGKVGALTDVEPLNKEGFTALPIEQQEIKADGTTRVIVNYERNEYTVTYDTQGGSYIKAKKGLYEETVDVYTETSGDSQLTCTTEEHTHTKKPSVDGSKDGEVQGCYTWKQVAFWGWWKYTCSKSEHTHTNACYKTTDATWDLVPTRQGYTFAGWYKDAGCTEKAEQSVALRDNVTVYAKWIAKEVNYTVAYFIENANDNNYSYLTSSAKTALVGSVVSETESTVPSGLDSTNFTFESSTSATVKADGSTVITVYYSRNVYTLTSNKTFRVDGKDKKLTLTAKYDANITDLMNNTWNEPTGYKYAWSLTGQNNEKIAVFDAMPSGNRTVYSHEYKASKTQKLNYWLENYTSSETKTVDGITYGLYKKVTVKYNYLTEEDFNDIGGYTKYKAQFSQSGYKWGEYFEDSNFTADFYYNANLYKLDLFGYQGVQLSSNDVKLGADIQSYLKEPEAPIENATFKGWFLDPEHTKQYEGNYQMPEGLSLYADWALPTFQVKYVSDEEVLKTETVEYQEKLDNYIPEREGYVFEGWYKEPEFTNEFDVNAPITQDTTIYAKWSQNKYTTYTVRYVVKDENEYRDIADRITGNGVVGQTMQFKAKAFTEEPYSKYAVDVPNQTLKLQAAASKNEVLFIYTAPIDLEYKVQYKYNDRVIKETDPLKAEAAKFNVYPAPSIAKQLQKDYGYVINETYKQAELVSDNSKNVIVFTLRLEGYTITYKGIKNVTGWEDSEGTENPNPPTYTADDTITIKNPVKTGYEFTGWECESGTTVNKGEHNGKNVVIEKGSRGNLTFEATWKEKAFTVTYDTNGGEPTTVDPLEDVKWNQSDLLPKTEVTKTGYTFAGWKYGETEVTKEDSYGKLAGKDTVDEIILVAQWEKDETQKKLCDIQ